MNAERVDDPGRSAVGCGGGGVVSYGGGGGDGGDDSDDGNEADRPRAEVGDDVCCLFTGAFRSLQVLRVGLL